MSHAWQSTHQNCFICYSGRQKNHRRDGFISSTTGLDWTLWRHGDWHKTDDNGKKSQLAPTLSNNVMEKDEALTTLNLASSDSWLWPCCGLLWWAFTICSKFLSTQNVWNNSNITSPVTPLFCGHIYHLLPSHSSSRVGLNWQNTRNYFTVYDLNKLDNFYHAEARVISWVSVALLPPELKL